MAMDAIARVHNVSNFWILPWWPIMRRFVRFIHQLSNDRTQQGTNFSVNGDYREPLTFLCSFKRSTSS